MKVVSFDHVRLIDEIGVTETIFPERESGVRLGKRVTSRGLLNDVRLGPEFSLQEMAVPSEWVGQTLRDFRVQEVLLDADVRG